MKLPENPKQLPNPIIKIMPPNHKNRPPSFSKKQMNQTKTKQRNRKWKCTGNQPGQYKDP